MEEAAFKQTVPNNYLGDYSTFLVLGIFLLYGILFLTALADAETKRTARLPKNFGKNKNNKNNKVNNSIPLSSTTTNLQDEEKPIDIRRIIGLVRRYWYLLVIFPLLSVGLATLYTRYLVDQYKVVATILIKKDDSKKGAQSSTAFDPSSLFSGNASNTADEVEILKSRTLMIEVLTELKISPIIIAKGRLKSAQYYKNSPIIVDTFSLSERIKETKEAVNLEIKLIDTQSFEAIKGKEKVTGRFGEPFILDSCLFVIKQSNIKESQKLFNINFLNIESLSKDYLGRLTVTPIKGAPGSGNSNAIALAFEDESTKRGVDVLSKLIEVYNRFGIEDKNSGDKNALKFIDDRVSLLTGEVTSGEKDIESYKKSQGIIADAASGIGYSLTKLGNSDAKITELEIRNHLIIAATPTILV
jgi:tyrosine-protein kinase Etk/Wzc